MAELPELSERNRGQIAKRVGVTPIARDSGIKEGLTRRRHQKDVQQLIDRVNESIWGLVMVGSSCDSHCVAREQLAASGFGQPVTKQFDGCFAIDAF